MQKITPIQHEKFYHIYNCGINGEKLFCQKENYEHFLLLCQKYVEPVANTYAWCLMPNHFHLLVKIKKEVHIAPYKPFNTDEFSNITRLNAPAGEANQSLNEVHDCLSKKMPSPDKYFSHLFNAYARYFNIRHHRHGSLFERPFKRKVVNDEHYFRTLVIYIHNNPVHHKLCKNIEDYKWSSYSGILSDKPSKLPKQKIFEWFGGRQGFIDFHKENHSEEEYLFFLNKGFHF